MPSVKDAKSLSGAKQSSRCLSSIQQKFRWSKISRVQKPSTRTLIAEQFSALTSNGIDYLLLLWKFYKVAVKIQWNKFRLSTRLMRKLLIVHIGVLSVLALLISATGTVKVAKKRDEKIVTDFFYPVTILGLLTLTLSVIGAIGIIKPNYKLTRIFAVTSFVVGHLIGSIVVAWYALIYMDSYLDEFTAQTHYQPSHGLIVERKGGASTSGNASFKAFFKDGFLERCFILLIFTSVVMMSAGITTTKLLITTSHNRGYFAVPVTDDKGAVLIFGPAQYQ